LFDTPQFGTITLKKTSKSGLRKTFEENQDWKFWMKKIINFTDKKVRVCIEKTHVETVLMQMNKLIIYVTCDASECCACSICMFLPS